MSLYTPILVLAAIATVFAVVSLGAALFVGPRRYNRAKLAAYECGIEPLAAEDQRASGHQPVDDVAVADAQLHGDPGGSLMSGGGSILARRA
jgi:hypothetical protein